MSSQREEQEAEASFKRLSTVSRPESETFNTIVKVGKVERSHLEGELGEGEAGQHPDPLEWLNPIFS